VSAEKSSKCPTDPEKSSSASDGDLIATLLRVLIQPRVVATTSLYVKVVDHIVIESSLNILQLVTWGLTLFRGVLRQPNQVITGQLAASDAGNSQKGANVRQVSSKNETFRPFSTICLTDSQQLCRFF
jgi:hypothetical protein